MSRKQRFKELPNRERSRLPFELFGPKSEDFVTSELQLSIGRSQQGIAVWLCASIRVGIVVFPVHLKNHAWAEIGSLASQSFC